LPTHRCDRSVLRLSQLVDLTRRKPQTLRRKLDGLEPVRTDGRTRYYASADALARIYGSPEADLARESARLAAAQAAWVERENLLAVGRILARVYRARGLRIRTPGAHRA